MFTYFTFGEEKSWIAAQHSASTPPVPLGVESAQEEGWQEQDIKIEESAQEDGWQEQDIKIEESAQEEGWQEQDIADKNKTLR